VICYFSAGSYEDWRTDANQLDSGDLGYTLDGWPDERWLDIRSDSILVIMQNLQFSTLVLPLDLDDSFRFTCQ
jgi:hypothetical protein